MAKRLLIALLAMLASPLESAAAPPPAAAFGTVPSFEHVSMSPDGALLAMDHNTPAGSRVIFFKLGQSAPMRVLNLTGGTKLWGITWADADTALLEVSVTSQLSRTRSGARSRYELYRFLAVDAAGGDPRMLLFDDSQDYITGARLLPVSPRRKDTVSIVTWDFSLTKRADTIGTRLNNDGHEDGWVMALFDVDTNTGKGRVVDQGTPYTSQWLVDPDGAPVARVEWNQQEQRSSVLVRDGNSWRTILATKGEGSLWLAGLSPDGRSLIGIGNNGTDRSRAWALPMDGSPPTVAFEDPSLEIANGAIDPSTGRVIGYWTAGPEGRIVYLDPERAAMTKALEKAFPDRWVEIVDRSTDGQRLLIRTESESAPAVYYLLDRSTHRADIVGETYAALADVELGQVRTITYPARDGTPIPAFLTLPPGKPDRNLPLVVLVHGGPESHDSGGFDWWAQFLASRGYAVLQPQFRGSTGYGDAHRLAGYGQWGALMQDDVSDGVRYLTGNGTADAKRVCIMGASYGGYAALAGATLTPDLYACAVSVNGVSDLPRMIGDTKARSGGESDVLAYWKDHIGSPYDPKVIAASPARSAAKAQAPILLIYGTNDTVVPPRQTTLMAEALKDTGKPHELVALPGEDHWLKTSATRTAVLEQIEAFLSKHL